MGVTGTCKLYHFAYFCIEEPHMGIIWITSLGGYVSDGLQLQ